MAALGFHWTFPKAPALNFCWLLSLSPFTLIGAPLPHPTTPPNKKRSSFLLLVLPPLGTEYLECYVKLVGWSWTHCLVQAERWELRRERINVLIFPLLHHCQELISGVYSECVFFFFPFLPFCILWTLGSFHPFARTIFYRMSWCLIYCTYYSSFWTAADII